LIANISGTDQAIDKQKSQISLINYDFSNSWWKQFGELWSTKKPCHL